MHELTATQSILNKALLKAAELNAGRIVTVHLAIGQISELDQISIQKHWDEISKGTIVEQAQLHFRIINAEVQCMSCFKKYHPLNGKIHCPHCGSYGAKILSGEEFYLESIDWDDE